MRLLFSILLVFAFTCQMNACHTGICPTHRPPPEKWLGLLGRTPRPTQDPRDVHPDAKKCFTDEDCEHPWMENEVANCENGYCNNYQGRWNFHIRH